jgi:hypothetical protein
MYLFISVRGDEPAVTGITRTSAHVSHGWSQQVLIVTFKLTSIRWVVVQLKMC